MQRRGHKVGNCLPIALFLVPLPQQQLGATGPRRARKLIDEPLQETSRCLLVLLTQRLDGLGQTGDRLRTLSAARQISRNGCAEDEDDASGCEQCTQPKDSRQKCKGRHEGCHGTCNHGEDYTTRRYDFRGVCGKTPPQDSWLAAYPDAVLGSLRNVPDRPQ